jgi:RNA polymerase sigma-70 factor (ECF subfamily)
MSSSGSALAPGAPAEELTLGCVAIGMARRASSPGPPAAPPSLRGAPAAASDGVPPAWFRAHVAGLWRVVARLGVPAHQVDDIVQETFLAAGRRRADIGPGQERAFLVATAIRLCSNYRRRAHVRREMNEGNDFGDEPSHAPNAEQLLIDKRWRELLERMLGELSESHRTVFVLYELEGFSVPEIAGLLELAVGTVSSRLARARAHFAELAAAIQLRLDQEEI